MTGYLLDTNHCSGLMDGEISISDHLEAEGDLLVATSVIVQGELVYMAERSDDRATNIVRVATFLQGIRIYPIDGDTAETYGALKAALMDHYGPKERRKRRQTTLRQLGFDDNDLWIAATALRHDLTLVSADSDFARMNEAQPLALEQWLPSP